MCICVCCCMCAGESIKPQTIYTVMLSICVYRFSLPCSIENCNMIFNFDSNAFLLVSCWMCVRAPSLAYLYICCAVDHIAINVEHRNIILIFNFLPFSPLFSPFIDVLDIAVTTGGCSCECVCVRLHLYFRKNCNIIFYCIEKCLYRPAIHIDFYGRRSW